MANTQVKSRAAASISKPHAYLFSNFLSLPEGNHHLDFDGYHVFAFFPQ